MEKITDFVRSAVARILSIFDYRATSSNDLSPETFDSLVERSKGAEMLLQEQRYAMRGVSSQPFADAEQWLKELLRIVSHELERQSEGPLHYDQCYDPDDPEYERLYGESRPVRMPDGPRKIWLNLGAERSPRGYRPVRVINGPLPTHMAIFAALTALEAERTSEDDLNVVLPLAESDQPHSHPTLLDVLQNEGIEKAVDAYLSARLPTKFAYARSLLRYYRPGFDALPAEERRALIERASRLINEYKSTLHKLLAFVEYGIPGKKLAVPSENVDRDVQAAVLAEVEKLSHAKIGEELGIGRYESDAVHGGNSRVAKMIKRGKDILESAWGKEGWREQVCRLQEERDLWGEDPEFMFAEHAPRFWELERQQHKEVSPTEAALPRDWSELQRYHHEYLVKTLGSLKEWALEAQANARRYESKLHSFREEASIFFEAQSTAYKESIYHLDQITEENEKRLRFIDKCLTNPFLLLVNKHDNDE